MNRLIFFILCIVIANATQVYELTTDDLRTSFLETSVLVIFVYDNNCPTCASEMKSFKEVANEMEFAIKPRFLTANCTVTKNMCNRYRLDKIPSVLIVKRDNTRVRFTKTINSVEFRSFLKNNIPQVVDTDSSFYIRIVFLVAIIIAIVLVILKTVQKNKVTKPKVDIEEHAPLVEHRKQEEAEETAEE